MKSPTFLQRADLWLILFFVWFGTLWHLSSSAAEVQTGVEIPHLDKLAHFGYFFGGGGLLSACLYRLSYRNLDWARLLAIVLFVMTSIGFLDEWHQTWVPGRSGNDAQDLCADVLGSLAGFLIFRRFHRWLS
jgi:VanZ family protein